MLPTAPRPATAAAALVAAGVDAIGVNCGVGPAGLSRRADAMGAPGRRRRRARSCPTPACRSASRASSSTPPARATSPAMVPRFLAAGARIIGGCCGTTPEHIARDAPGARRVDRQARAAAAPRRTRRRPPVRGTPRPSDRATRPQRHGRRRHRRRRAWPARSPRAASSSASRSIRRARSASSARSRPPAAPGSRRRPRQHQRLRHGARAHGRAGGGLRHPARPRPRVPRPLHDARPQPDGPRIGAARRARAGRPQHPGADRRPAAHRRLPDRAPASGTSIRSGSIGILARLNRGEDQAGKPIGSRPGFTIACALDPTAADAATEMGPPRAQARRRRAPDHDPADLRPRPGRGDASWRRDAGSGRAASRSRSCWASCRCTRARHAEFLHNEVPGITIPDAARAAMHAAGERGAEVGLEMAHRAARGGRPRVAGTYIMPSFGRYELAAELVRRLRTGAPVS